MIYFKYPPGTLSVLHHWGEPNTPCGCGREFTVSHKLTSLQKLLQKITLQLRDTECVEEKSLCDKNVFLC